MRRDVANSVSIELDALKRLVGAARLSGFSNPEAAEDAAEDDVALWRGRARGPQRVELTVEAAEQITAAAVHGLIGVQDCDQAWKARVVSDLQYVAAACRRQKKR